MPLPISAIEEALADLRQGKMTVLIDNDEGRGEANLCLAAELISPEAVNFMAAHARGLVCLILTEEKMQELGIPMLGNGNSALTQQAFGASIEARHGVTTGISAHDRATTISAVMMKALKPNFLFSKTEGGCDLY